MKILERASEVFSCIFICKICGSKCEADAGDLVKHPADHRRRPVGVVGRPEAFTVSCGVCGGTHTVSPEYIPMLVRLNASTVRK